MTNTHFILQQHLSFTFIVHKIYGYPKNRKNKSFIMSWIYIASYQTSLKTYWAQQAFVSTIIIDPTFEFIPYENLTNNDFQKWIDNLPNNYELKNILLEIINNQIKKEYNLNLIE